MIASNRKKFEEALTEVAAAYWHDAEHRSWMAGILAVLTIYAAQARGTTRRSQRAAEKIVWTVFQCVTEPESAQTEAQAHLDFYAAHNLALPPHVANGATPAQQAADATQLNAFARRLIVLFGVQKSLHDALLCMQSDQENPFYAHEYWQQGRSWIEAQFFAEVL